MKLVAPTPITSSNLTASNVLENDAPAWSAGTYLLGDQVIYDHEVYEVIVSSTTDQPDVGAAASPPTWLNLGATNRYKMFDDTITTQTVNSGTIEVEITPAQIVNGLAFFGLSGNEITVVMDDPTEGEVYNQTRSLQDSSLITSWYSYFFEPISFRSDMVFLNLPAYSTGIITVIIDAGASDAKCGEMLMGVVRNLGVTNFGTSVSIQDYSIKSTDAFGNVIVVERPFSKRADYDVTVETAFVGSVQQVLASIRTTPTVFVGDENRQSTIVYGFYKQFNIVISTPSISDCTIEVEGLT